MDVIEEIIMNYMVDLSKHSQDNYKDQKEVFKEFINVLEKYASYNYEDMYKIIFKKSKIISLMSSILIDSDNLNEAN